MGNVVSQSVSNRMKEQIGKNTVDMNIKSSEVVIPTDQQTKLLQTAVTHTGVVVPNGTANAQATWQPVPDGMSDFINNLSIDTSVANVYTYVDWSDDGTNKTGSSEKTTSSTFVSNGKTSDTWRAIGGAFYKVLVFNGDATPRTCSANIKFRP